MDRAPLAVRAAEPDGAVAVLIRHCAGLAGGEDCRQGVFCEAPSEAREARVQGLSEQAVPTRFNRIQIP